MAVGVSDLRDYLRLPPDSDAGLERYLAAARSKARAAGVPDYESNAQYDLFLMALAAMYYDNRGMGFSGNYQTTTGEAAQALINSFVLELRHAEEDPEVEA